MEEDALLACRKTQEDAERAGQDVPDMEHLLVENGHLTDRQLRLMRRAQARLRRDEVKSPPIRIGGYEVIGQLGDAGILIPLSASKRNRAWEADGLLDLLTDLEGGGR